MFASTLNGAAFTDHYAFSTHANKCNGKKESDAFSEVKHEHDNPITSLEYAPVSKFIIHVTMHERKASINISSCSKTTKPQQGEGFAHMRVTGYFFIRHRLGWYVCAHKTFAYLSSFAKVSVPAKSISP